MVNREGKDRKVVIDVDLEKFRWSLVGDGYLREEAASMSEEELVEVLKQRITDHINEEYDRGERLGLYDEEEDESVTYGDIYEEFKSNYPDWANEVLDYRPYFPPYTKTGWSMNIVIWMKNHEVKRYSYETKKLYPVEEG